MATSDAKPSASVLIPEDYQEDVRTAIVSELADSTANLSASQTEVVGNSRARDDRDSAADLLYRDVRLLQDLLPDFGCDVTLKADRETWFHVLEEMVRTVTYRLNDQMRFGPLDMAYILELTDRIRWAARQAESVLPSAKPQAVS